MKKTSVFLLTFLLLISLSWGLDKRLEDTSGLFAVKINGKWGFIDAQGNIAIQPQFEEVSFFSEGLAAVRSAANGKIGYINRNGKFVIDPKYDMVFLFHNGLAAVSLSGRYGFIDRSGKEVIGLQFKFADVFIGGLARVKTDDKWIYIDKTGKTVWPKNENGTQRASQDDILISYSMAGLTSVVIRNNHLQYITSKYIGKNPYAAGGPDDYVRTSRESSISSTELEQLLELIRSSGFLKLKDTYGALDPSIRHYPVRITIKMPQMEKTVLFRSNPDYKAPAAFQAIEKALLQLAQKKTY